MKHTLSRLNTFFYKSFDYLCELFYPGLCIVCDSRTGCHSELFCTSCQVQTSRTNQQSQLHNTFTGHFKGKIELVSGSALYYFIKNGALQQALHQIKYHNRPDIALSLGYVMGESIKDRFPYNTLDLIIPVPLHFSKKNKRGYNQSALFGHGISAQLNIPMYEQALFRNTASISQTEKTRSERFENVSRAFEAKPNLSLHNKHILLVDDVLTTGATLEACALALMKLYKVRISMVTIAMALKN